MNPRFLKQKGSGHIYPWTQRLAERSDMEPYEPPRPTPEPTPAPPPPPPPSPAQAPSRPPKTPTQNAKPTTALPPLDSAIEAFRKEASQPSRMKGEA